MKKAVGGPGNGPGELGRNARFLSVAPGDTLIVPDITNRRVNRYAPDGTTLPSTPLRPELGNPMRYNLNGKGVFVAQVRTPAPDTVDYLVVLEPSGLWGDTIISFVSGSANRVAAEVHQFSPEPMWNVTDSLSVVYGVNHDLKAFFAYLDRAWLDAGVLPSRLPELRTRVHFAEFYPAYYAIHIGYRRSIWVQQIQTPGGLSDEELERYNFVEEFGSTRSDVFDSEGRYLGVVEMPARFQPRTFLGDKIYGVWRDDLDVQYVMRLTVVGGEEEAVG